MFNLCIHDRQTMTAKKSLFLFCISFYTGLKGNSCDMSIGVPSIKSVLATTCTSKE